MENINKTKSIQIPNFFYKGKKSISVTSKLQGFFTHGQLIRLLISSLSHQFWPYLPSLSSNYLNLYLLHQKSHLGQLQMGHELSEIAPLRASPPPPTSLAPGFRFHPTDEELVQYYLKRKACAKPFRFEAVTEIDVYKSEPWELAGLSLSNWKLSLNSSFKFTFFRFTGMSGNWLLVSVQFCVSFVFIWVIFGW